jgi:hypothetical protein|tara:strand:- start:54 stop:437 length:384 start_codon:yes stop_codon:yes gene_type:complete
MVVLNGREFRTEPNSTRLITTPVGETLQANTRQVVDFANRYGGPATSLIIDNRDGAVSVTYNINGQFNPPQVLPASAFRTFDNMIISRVEVDSTGGPSTQPVQITAQVAGRSYEIGPRVGAQQESQI